MIKRVVLAAFSLLLLATFVPVKAQAGLFDGARDEACRGARITTDDATGCDTSSGGAINSLLKDVLNILSLAVGVVAVIMVIVSGLKYVTSQGDGANTASAKNTLLYAIVGLTIVVLSQVIVRFVLSKATPLPACPAGQTQLASGGACRTP